MKGKQGSVGYTALGVIVFLIVVVSLILFFKQVMGGLSTIMVAVTVIGVLSFLGWYVIDAVY